MDIDFDAEELESQLADVAVDILVSNLFKTFIPKGECDSEIINKIYDVFRKNGVSPITSLEILKDLADAFADTGEKCDNASLKYYIKPTFPSVKHAFTAYKELQDWFDTRDSISCMDLYKICRVSVPEHCKDSYYKTYGYTKVLFEDFSINCCGDGSRYVLETPNPIKLIKGE